MNANLSSNAQSILSAALATAPQDGEALNDHAIERAISKAVSKICSQNMPYGEETAVDALMEIAQQHVRLVLNE